MEYKISELVARTNVPKSTILYYIRKGLLPEAKKLKSNVHRYNDEHIELIGYIKYMQEEIGSTNEQIKFALQHKNQSLSSSFSMIEPLMNTLSAVARDAVHYTKKEFLKYCNVDSTLLEQLLDDGLLVPINDDDFTEKEASVIRLILSFKEVGVEYAIIKEYVKHAKALSQLESQMQMQLCNVRSDQNFPMLWKIMFETLFNAKEYLFNRYTYKVLLKSLKDEIIR
ncbi:MAG TPA: MerR family transcriptional regulator [Sulfuricurvum sp.]|nr:MAG: MerR family transcriptional regulator [Campylobacterales bacterium 16-40-21]OZA02745.1 MAG: MerR family transcriptional regulator [Sulfuricurvum sp. 17-40-25]HQS66712.1 MerR family transcriptional regulator [Sulfuricurvum sp.]HQT37331.1 MerR family transcriptional regulator [Sulfuricurvum sp.]